MLETESFFQVALHRDKPEERSKWETVVSFILAPVYVCYVAREECRVNI